jgi:hypothetical protein
MIGAFRNFLYISYSFFSINTFRIQRTLLYIIARRLFLYRLWKVVFLSRYNRLSFNFLYRHASISTLTPCFVTNYLRFIFWYRIYVKRGFYKQASIPLKFICYQCNFPILLLRLFFNNLCLRVHRSILFTLG